MKRSLILLTLLFLKPAFSVELRCTNEVLHYLKNENINFEKLSKANLESINKHEIKKNLEKLTKEYEKDLSNTTKKENFHQYLEYDEEGLDELKFYRKSDSLPNLKELEMRIKNGAYKSLQFHSGNGMSITKVRFSDSCQVDEIEIRSVRENGETEIRSRLFGEFCSDLRNFQNGRWNKKEKRQETIAEYFEHSVAQGHYDKDHSAGLFYNTHILPYFNRLDREETSFFNEPHGQYDKIQELFKICLDKYMSFTHRKDSIKSKEDVNLKEAISQ
jgi:hypothetical protein